MTDTFPSDWHIQEAINRTPSHTSMTLVRVKENPAAYGYILAHARSLAEFLPEPEPVDPYVEAAAQLFEAWGCPEVAKRFRQGVPDSDDITFLAKLRELFPAYGDTLAEFLPAPEPVDPYTEAAWEIMDIYGWRQTAKYIREGMPDINGEAVISKLREIFPNHGADTRTDLEIAREAAAKVWENDCSEWARRARNGDEDNGVMIQSALLAVRMARGEA